ncbi:MAG TPA: GNAT family N-acetyltransferase, partial [Polyangiales bacterium]|nr:GNAT family N-acetyltransferase [Polyangiales bacterium]
ADDPVVSHLLRNSKQSDAWTKYFQIGVEVAFEQGEVWTTDELTGACLFFAPDQWRISIWKELESAWRIARATSLATMLNIRTVFHLLEGALPKEPHYYLLAIGVSAAHRNRGLGTALMRPLLARCQEDQRPAYLENTDPKNHRFYERHGFELTRSLTLPNGTPPIDLMWRP